MKWIRVIEGVIHNYLQFDTKCAGAMWHSSRMPHSHNTLGTRVIKSSMVFVIVT